MKTISAGADGLSDSVRLEIMKAFELISSPGISKDTKQITLDILSENYGADVVKTFWMEYVTGLAESGMSSIDQKLKKVIEDHADDDVRRAVEWVEEVFRAKIVTHVTFDGEVDPKTKKPTPPRPFVNVGKLEGIRDEDHPVILFYHGKRRMWETVWVEPWKIALNYIEIIIREDLNVGQKIDRMILESPRINQKPFGDYFKKWRDEGTFKGIANKKLLRPKRTEV